MDKIFKEYLEKIDKKINLIIKENLFYKIRKIYSDFSNNSVFKKNRIQLAKLSFFKNKIKKHNVKNFDHETLKKIIN